MTDHSNNAPETASNDIMNVNVQPRRRPVLNAAQNGLATTGMAAGTPEFGPAPALPPFPPTQSSGADPTQTIMLALQHLIANQAAAQVVAPARPATPVTSHAPLKWTGLEHLNTSDPSSVDTFFVHFERLMKASSVPQGNWARRFLECPMVGESVKDLLDRSGTDPLPYPEIRSTILETHGPLFTVAYWKSQLHAVKGTDRESVRNTLNRLLKLHNRAATDEGRELLTDRDLCICFANAFPPEVAQGLTKFFKPAQADPEPLEFLFRMAPEGKRQTQVHTIAQSTEDSAFVAAADRKRKRARQPRAPTTTPEVDDAFITAVVDQLEKRARFQHQPQRQSQGQSRQNRCSGCGGSCQDRRQCPAQGRACNKCGKPNHFATVCRGADMGRRPGPPVSGTNQSQPHFRSAPRPNPPP